jgi:hypothetical protein
VMFAARAKDRQADGVVAADAQRTRSGRKHRSEAALYSAKCVFDAERIDWQIAEIRGTMFHERVHAKDRIPRANNRGLIADAARTEARPRPIRGAAIERNADDGNIQLFSVRDVGQAHESGHAGETRIFESIDRLRMGKAKRAAGLGHRLGILVSEQWGVNAPDTRRTRAGQAAKSPLCIAPSP